MEASSGMGQVVMIVLFFAIMYFMLIRPQQKRQAAQNAVLRTLEPGMDVVTLGGMYGHIVDITEEYIDLLVSEPDVVVRYRRSAISDIVAPVDETDDIDETELELDASDDGAAIDEQDGAEA